MRNLTEICAFSGQFLVTSVSRRRIELPARPILGLLAPTSLWDSRGKAPQAIESSRGHFGALKAAKRRRPSRDGEQPKKNGTIRTGHLHGAFNGEQMGRTGSTGDGKTQERRVSRVGRAR